MYMNLKNKVKEQGNIDYSLILCRFKVIFWFWKSLNKTTSEQYQFSCGFQKSCILLWLISTYFWSFGRLYRIPSNISEFSRQYRFENRLRFFSPKVFFDIWLIFRNFHRVCFFFCFCFFVRSDFYENQST